jgi:formylmethanofuran dehydrogenase subunit C
MTLTQKLKSKDLFDSLNEEQEKKKERNITMSSKNSLDSLLSRLRFFTQHSENQDLGFVEMQKLAQDITPESVSAKMIEELSLNIQESDLEGYGKSCAGIYLSSLINKSDRLDFVIHTKHLQSGIDYLGSNCSRQYITVVGNAGDNAGHDMELGRLHIQGDAGEGVGIYSCAVIEVEGSAGDLVGHGLDRGGKINIRKNAGDKVGCGNNGGIIYVDGDCGGYPGLNMLNGLLEIVGTIGTVGKYKGSRIGGNMHGGEIRVLGDYVGTPGQRMTGGSIHIYGKKPRLPESAIGGSIYHENKPLILNGRKVK